MIGVKRGQPMSRQANTSRTQVLSRNPQRRKRVPPEIVRIRTPKFQVQVTPPRVRGSLLLSLPSKVPPRRRKKGKSGVARLIPIMSHQLRLPQNPRSFQRLRQPQHFPPSHLKTPSQEAVQLKTTKSWPAVRYPPLNPKVEGKLSRRENRNP